MYLILKQKFESVAADDSKASIDYAKKENETFVKRLTVIQDIIIKKF